MTHRVFVVKPWVGAVERDGERPTDIGFKPNRFVDAVEGEGKSGVTSKDLKCFCPLEWPCHADVLLRWAANGR